MLFIFINKQKIPLILSPSSSQPRTNLRRGIKPNEPYSISVSALQALQHVRLEKCKGVYIWMRQYDKASFEFKLVGLYTWLCDIHVVQITVKGRTRKNDTNMHRGPDVWSIFKRNKYSKTKQFHLSWAHLLYG